MSGWKYLVKTSRKTLKSDITEYKKLCERLVDARRQYNLSRASFTDVGCTRYPCKDIYCKYYEVNRNYGETLHMMHMLEKQRKIYWVQKFANCR